MFSISTRCLRSIRQERINSRKRPRIPYAFKFLNRDRRRWHIVSRALLKSSEIAVIIFSSNVSPLSSVGLYNTIALPPLHQSSRVCHRATACQDRESPVNDHFGKLFLFCSKISFGKLFSKVKL